MRRIALMIILLLVNSHALAALKYHWVVAKDGTGDFTRIQDAIDASKAFPKQDVIIDIKNGVYQEKVRVFEWNNRLTLRGEDKFHTIIRFGDHFSAIARGRNSTFHTATLQVDGEDFRAENLTIENSAGPVGQAVALAVTADNARFYNIRLLANQDTLYVTGKGNKQYFKDCYIEGTVDFIFGRATAVFDNCHIHSKADSYITAASTPQGQTFGLVFFNATLTANKDVTKVYLGRPWREFAKTVFINTQMGAHILPQGWHDWGKPHAQYTTYYGEYNSQGLGAKPQARVEWSKQLQQGDLRKYMELLDAFK